MKEIVQIEVERYRTPVDGKPTCATDMNTGDVCKFFRIMKFGTEETCAFASHGEKLWRRDKDIPDGFSGTGYLIPGNFCPLFD